LRVLQRPEQQPIDRLQFVHLALEIRPVQDRGREPAFGKRPAEKPFQVVLGSSHDGENEDAGRFLRSLPRSRRQVREIIIKLKGPAISLQAVRQRELLVIPLFAPVWVGLGWNRLETAALLRGVRLAAQIFRRRLRRAWWTLQGMKKATTAEDGCRASGQDTDGVSNGCPY
jgi:hypothetical protein